jgi:hypothetical protein
MYRKGRLLLFLLETRGEMHRHLLENNLGTVVVFSRKAFMPFPLSAWPNNNSF